MKNNLNKSYVCLKPFRNGLSIFLGVLFLGLISCSTATDSTSSSPTKDKTPPTHTISFNLNGGSFISPQITNLKVVDNTAIEETKLGGILSYPPTGTQSNIQAVTRNIFEWRNNGTKYDFSALVSSDLTLEAVWSNSCGKAETFHPANRTQLTNYVNAAVGANSTTNLNHIDTSAITDMSNLFIGKKNFNGKIGCWNTANVNNMRIMFWDANVFNQDISSWNVANIANMYGLFQNANAFNQDISSWNVGNVTTMSIMFRGAKVFDQDLSSWSVNNVTNHTDMFTDSAMESKTAKHPKFDETPPTVTISTNKSLEIDKTATITFTFSEEVNGFTKNDVRFSIDDFSVNSVNDIVIGNFITNNPKENPKEYFLDITPKVAGTLTISIPANSFYDLLGNKNTDSFSNNFLVKEDKTPPIATINSDTIIEGIPAYLSFIFSEKVTNFTPDDIQFLTNEANGVNAAKGNFVTNSLTSYSLEITPKAIGTLYVSIPANSFYDLYGNQNDKHYSNSFTVLDSSTATHTISFKLNGGSFISPQITNLKVVDNTAIEETRLGRILSYPPTGPKPSIQAVTRDVFEWRTNGTKYELSTPVSSDLTLEAVWRNSCGKVETFHPTNRNQLKNYVDAAIGANPTTNLNHIDTSAITDMNYLFRYKRSFNGKIDCWNTANVNNMDGMFSYAQAFNQNISGWNVSNVNNMNNMFNRAYAFNQDIGSWDVGNVNNMYSMFNNASKFNKDISSWNVANVTNMSIMFRGAKVFDQDLSSWSVSNVTDHTDMFAYSAMASKTAKHPVFNKP